MILIFALSAAFHITIFYPIQHEFSIRPYAIFYLANGIGCALEREYYRRTGRKVGGWVGWIWTWSVLLISGVPVAEHEYSNGWAGVNRGELGKDRSLSLVEWVVYWLDMGSHPKS
jgi:hypothetical protein